MIFRRLNLSRILVFETWSNHLIIPAWTLLAVPLFCMPTFSTVTLETMNYASVVFVGFMAVSAVWYWAWGYQNYAGPPTEGVEIAAENVGEGSVTDKSAKEF